MLELSRGSRQHHIDPFSYSILLIFREDLLDLFLDEGTFLDLEVIFSTLASPRTLVEKINVGIYARSLSAIRLLGKRTMLLRNCTLTICSVIE